MAVRKVLQLGESLLRAACDVVVDPTSPEVASLVSDLRDTLEDTFQRTGYGRGIAAPQIGAMKRVVYLSARVLGNELVLINPKVIEHSKETVNVWDSCLCFLSIFMKVDRYKNVTVEYLDLEGVRHLLEAGPEHDLSELLQHEIDHLDGVLCLDHMKNIREVVAREVFEEIYSSDSPYAKRTK